MALPTITTQLVTPTTSNTAITANGNIVTTDSTCISEGFVYDIVSHSLPTLPPSSSGYANNVSQSGSFSTGAFSELISGLTVNSRYYLRAFAENSTGYSYGNELQTIILSASFINEFCMAQASGMYATGVVSPTYISNGILARPLPLWSGATYASISNQTYGGQYTTSLLTDLLNGKIEGYCYTDITESIPIINQTVFCLCKSSLQLVGVTITDSNGFYEFKNLVMSKTYLIFMLDSSNTYNATAYDNISPTGM